MSFINSVLKVFVGDKSEKDVKSLQPLVKEIKSFEQQLEGLSHDELRQKTASFKARIAEDCKEINDKIAELKEEVENSNDIDQKSTPKSTSSTKKPIKFPKKLWKISFPRPLPL